MRTVPSATPLHNAFGDLVHVALHRLGHLVEQFVQADEAWTFHVPMRLLHL
jgi:hypothetical protein